MQCADKVVSGYVQRPPLAAGGQHSSLLHVCNKGSRPSQQHGVLLLRRRCLRTPCCTTLKHGLGRTSRWDCSSPCASSSRQDGCANTSCQWCT